MNINNHLTKIKFLFLFLFSIILLSITSVSTQSTGVNGIKGIEFQKNVKNFYLSEPWNDQVAKNIDISLEVRFNQVNYLNNPFQTAQGNTGIRMEVSNNSELMLVIGSKEKPGYIALKVIDDIEKDRWYDVHIKASSEIIQVWVDQNLIVDGVYENLNYTVSNVAIGAGFSRQRSFDGIVKNFNIQYEFSQVLNKKYLIVLKVAAFLLFFFILFAKEVVKVFNRVTLKYTCKEYVHNKNKLIYIFLLIPVSIFIINIAYYLYISIFYIPPSAISGLFMGFRHLGGMNDISSVVYSQWLQLALISSLFFLVIYISYWLAVKKNISFRIFLFVIYIATIIVTFLFLFLATGELEHFTKQVTSINNGIYYSTNTLFSKDMGLTDVLERVRYIFSDLSSNNSGYTIPGTTHPPGVFLISAVVGFFANLISDDFSLGWGIVVTSINALLIPVVMLISREAFSERIAKLTGIFMITVPSVCMHFSAMFDVIFSLSVMLGSLFLIYGLKYAIDGENKNLIKMLNFGIISGLFFIIAAQGTYGHVVPILAFISSFILLVRKDGRLIIIFFIGMAIPVVLYFIFEFYMSSGRSFWPVRALNIVDIVGDGLIESRPFPLAYFANFIIIFTIGGILVFPTIMYVVYSTFMLFKRMYLQSLTVLSQEQLMRNFLVLSVFLMTLFLLMQTTVRLEVERTWHWYLSAVWPLIGIFYIAFSAFLERIFMLKNVLNEEYYGSLVLIYFQALITLVLSISIMDYY